MICTKCGARVPDGATVCRVCGAPVRGGIPSPRTQPPSWQSGSGRSGSNNSFASNNNLSYSQRSFPMGWHGFVVYFALWYIGISLILNAIGNIIIVAAGLTLLNALKTLLSGLISFSFIDYNNPPWGVFLAIGSLNLLLGAFAIFTRFRLAHRKRDGLLFLMIFHIAGMVVTLIYEIIMCILVQGFYFDLTAILAFLAYGGLMIVNYFYYVRRSSVFNK